MYGLIYMHTCKKNGKSYIGQTTKTMKERWIEHIYNTKPNKFTRAIKKYGRYAWDHKVIAYADTKEDLDMLEIFYIQKYDTIKNGYNLKSGGSHGLHSEESKKLMSIHRMGNPHPQTEETKEKIRAANKGRKFSLSHRINISKAKKGKPLKKEHIELLSKMFSGSGNPNFGKKTQKKTIEKMRAKMGKRILCIELDRIFSCSGEAAEFLGVKRCGIQRALLHGNMSHGYHWKYL